MYIYLSILHIICIYIYYRQNHAYIYICITMMIIIVTRRYASLPFVYCVFRAAGLLLTIAAAWTGDRQKSAPKSETRRRLLHWKAPGARNDGPMVKSWKCLWGSFPFQHLSALYLLDLGWVFNRDHERQIQFRRFLDVPSSRWGKLTVNPWHQRSLVCLCEVSFW